MNRVETTVNDRVQERRLPRSQQGAVLVVAMIFLITLTLLAVSSMNTTSLEEKMASNLQESSRAFNAAETGLSQAMADVDSFDTSGSYSVPVTDIADTKFQAEYSTDFLGFSAPPLKLNDTAPWGLCTQSANFNLRSTGTTPSGVSNTVNGGAYQLRKKPGCI